jgi:UDP-3-O-[3-hydroxymyristoyl] glucosamine N-acyltransferase
VDAPAVEDEAAERGWNLLMATITQIAELLGTSVLQGAGDAEMVRVASLDGAGPDAVVFAVEDTTLVRALQSSAGVVLAAVRDRDGEKYAEPNVDPRILWVKDARYAFAVVARELKGRSAVAGVHDTAVIGERVKIGSGTSVGPGAVIGNDAQIGEDCEIGARVTIYPGTELGDRVVVQAGAVLGSTGFGYAPNRATGEYVLFPQQGTLVIEDDVDIGANTTIDRGALGETRIGRGTKIDNLVHVGHNCTIGRNVVIAAQTGISGSSVVEDGAILGGQVGIGEHATVGAGVILGGGAGVLSGKKMRGPGKVFWGRPARPLKEYLRDLASLKKR